MSKIEIFLLDLGIFGHGPGRTPRITLFTKFVWSIQENHDRLPLKTYIFIKYGGKSLWKSNMAEPGALLIKFHGPQTWSRIRKTENVHRGAKVTILRTKFLTDIFCCYFTTNAPTLMNFFCILRFDVTCWIRSTSNQNNLALNK